MRKNMPWYKKLGPGLLYAGAAVGVSHLVQATRAGALYAFDLFLIVLIVNLIKYPFFEASARYVAASGKNLLEGYYKIHPVFLVVFLFQTLATMFIVQSAVTLVTGGLLIHFIGFSFNLEVICFLVLFFLFFILVRNKVHLLDLLMKPMMFVLVLCSILALIFAFTKSQAQDFTFMGTFNWDRKKDILFLAALIGWMPSPLDCSIWHSVWSVDKQKELKIRSVKKDALFDLRFSYTLTMILALLFLSLGALVMHPSGEVFSSSAVIFSSQLINLYSKNLGAWSAFLVSLACVMTMVSTTLSCWDAFSRVMSEGSSILGRNFKKLSYHFYLILIATGSLLIISFFVSDMKSMIDFATTVAFLVAPLIAFLCLLIIFRSKEARQGVFPFYLRVSAVFSTLLLSFFTFFYLSLG